MRLYMWTRLRIFTEPETSMRNSLQWINYAVRCIQGMVRGIQENYDIEITDPAMKAFRLFREKQYNEAGALYEELYKSEKDAYYIEMACEAYNLPRMGRTY